MYYTIYKVTNKINGKYYIGKHQTKNLDDGYMGSGKLIKRAIKKYGIQNFEKAILAIFESKEEMNAKEKELVSLDKNSYNLCEGGHGGFGYINSNKLNMSISELNERRLKELKTDKALQEKLKVAAYKGGTAAKLKREQDFILGRKKKSDFITFGFKGKKHSEETKRKISETKKLRQTLHLNKV